MRLGNALTLTSILAEGEAELQEASSEVLEILNAFALLKKLGCIGERQTDGSKGDKRMGSLKIDHG